MRQWQLTMGVLLAAIISLCANSASADPLFSAECRFYNADNSRHTSGKLVGDEEGLRFISAKGEQVYFAPWSDVLGADIAGGGGIPSGGNTNMVLVLHRTQPAVWLFFVHAETFAVANVMQQIALHKAK